MNEVWIVEAVDSNGRWELMDAIGGGCEFQSRFEAEAAMDELCWRNKWDPIELRVRSFSI